MTAWRVLATASSTRSTIGAETSGWLRGLEASILCFVWSWRAQDEFRQEPGRFMDLPPESIGGTYRYRVTPVATDRPALGNRLAEVTGRPITEFPGRVLDEMMRLMRRDQRAGKRLIYDDAEHLLALYARASG
jgi:hypothetical protein